MTEVSNSAACERCSGITADSAFVEELSDLGVRVGVDELIDFTHDLYASIPSVIG